MNRRGTPPAGSGRRRGFLAADDREGAIVTHDSSVARRAQRTGLMDHGQLAIRPGRPMLTTRTADHANG
jgi:hypothetical protein